MKKILLVLCCGITLMYSCRKDFYGNSETGTAGEVRQSTMQSFFKLKPDAPRETRLIAENLESGEFQKPFLVGFAKKNGYPVWDKIVGNISTGEVYDEKKESKNTVTVSSKSTSSVQGETAGFFLVPLIDTVTREVLSYMAVEKINDTSYKYKTYNKKEILKTSPLNDTQKINSKPLLGLFAYFEKTVNGKISSSFRGPAISFDFTNVNFRMSDPTSTSSKKEMMAMERRLNSLPQKCWRKILASYYVEYSDGSFDLVLILGSCETMTLPDVVVTTIRPHNQDGNMYSGGYSSGYSGPISGNPLAWGAPGTGSGSGGTTGTITNTQGTGIPGAEGTEQSGIQQDPWNVFWASLSSSGLTTIDVLGVRLGGLNDVERIWLGNHLHLADELDDFLATDNSQSRIDDAWHHLNTMMNDPDYLAFVEGYESTNPNQGVWWENDAWLSVPTNINFDVDGYDNDLWKELNAAEKQLVYQHPIAAYKISKNAAESFRRTAIDYPGIIPLNNKADAFRHASFAAMNMRSCGFDDLGNMIAKLFGDAHETTTPTLLAKEKQMDLFNNDVGYSIGNVMFTIFLSNDAIITEVRSKMTSGYLRYLSPLKTPAQDPDYYGAGGTANLNTATHGIFASTVLTPTDM